MFERFTDTARTTLFFARYETTALGGMTIEPEHMLLGLLRADKGSTPHLFAVANLSYSDARNEIRARWGPRQQVPTSVELPFDDLTERILQYAAEEADRLADKHVGTGQLLLGILREDRSFAAWILKEHGMRIDDLREQILKPPVGQAPEPEAAVEVSAMRVKGEAFDAVVSVERIRVLAEELRGSENPIQDTRSLVDEIHYHLDALKRHFV